MKVAIFGRNCDKGFKEYGDLGMANMASDIEEDTVLKWNMFL